MGINRGKKINLDKVTITEKGKIPNQANLKMSIASLLYPVRMNCKPLLTIIIIK